jgi:hypothetical protein
MPKARADAALWIANVGQVFGVGPRVDGAISVDDHLVGQAHEEH